MDEDLQKNKYPKIPEKYRIDHIYNRDERIKQSNREYPKVLKKYKKEYFSKPHKEYRQQKVKTYKLSSLKFLWHLGGKYLFIIISFFIIIFILSKSEEPSKEKAFPELKEPKIINFQWQYAKQDYTLPITLYKTAFEYYNALPKTYTCIEGDCPINWEKEWHGNFLKEVEGDDTVSQIAAELQRIGQKNNLNDDQILESAIAFVQTIPYDIAKIKLNEILPRYPIVLYLKF